MLTVERPFAEKLLEYLQGILPLIPPTELEKFSLLRTQLETLQCDPALLAWVLDLIHKYILRRGNRPKNELFFDDVPKDTTDESEQNTEELVDLIHDILEQQSLFQAKKHNGMRR